MRCLIVSWMGDFGGENSLHFAETAVGVEHLLDAQAVARPLLDLIKIVLAILFSPLGVFHSVTFQLLSILGEDGYPLLPVLLTALVVFVCHA